MPTIDRRPYRTTKLLGEALIEADPEKFGHRDPEDLGRAVKDMIPGVSVQASDFGDIDFGIAAEKFPGSASGLAERSVEGMWEMGKHPVETGEEMFRAGQVGLMNLAEGAKAQGPPKPGERRGGVVVEAGRNLLSQLAGTKLVSDAQRERVESVGREFQESFEPRNIQDDPAEFLSNLGVAFPARGTATAAAKLGVKGAGKARRLMDVVDPASAPFALAAEGVKGGVKAGKWAATTAVPWSARKAKDVLLEPVIGKVRKTDYPMRKELFNNLAGFSTGNGPVFVKEMQEIAGTMIDRLDEAGNFVREKANDIVRSVTKSGDPGDWNETLIKRGLRAVDRVKKAAMDEFALAKRLLPTNAWLDIQDIQQAARGPLEEFRVQVKGGYTLEPKALPLTELEELSRLEAGQSVVGQRRVPTGEARLVFPDFGGGEGISTTISAFGSGREKIDAAFLALINAPPEAQVLDIYHFRRAIDDAISVASGETSKEARAALIALKEILDGKLREVPEFQATIDRHASEMAKIDRYHEELGLTPGKITATGEFIVGPNGINVEQTANKLLGSVDERKAIATRLKLLKELQVGGSDGSLVPLVIGIGSEPLLGSGLVVKSQISEVTRLVIGTALLTGGSWIRGLGAAPAIQLFSPRGMSEWVLTFAEKEAAGRPRVFTGTREKAAKWAEDIHSRVQEIDRLTGGEFGRMARREGMTVGRLIERLQSQSEVDISGVDAPSPEEEASQSFLEKFSGMASRVLNPLTGQPQ